MKQRIFGSVTGTIFIFWLISAIVFANLLLFDLAREDIAYVSGYSTAYLGGWDQAAGRALIRQAWLVNGIPVVVVSSGSLVVVAGLVVAVRGAWRLDPASESAE